MVKITVITGFPKDDKNPFRKLEDLLPYQDSGVKISLKHNLMGPLSCNNDIEHALGTASIAQAAVQASEEGADAIVIESMGDTGLIPSREAVSIPVVGFAETSIRVAQMLGRKFGIITVGRWQGFAMERLLQMYGLTHQYVKFECLGVQPFFTDGISDEELNEKLIRACINLIEADVDTIVLGGSYFIGKNIELTQRLAQKNYKDILIIDPFPLAIRFARMLCECKLMHSKKIYANPIFDTPICGFPNIKKVPGLKIEMV